MQPKPRASGGPTLRGQVEVLEILQSTCSRKVVRRVQMWMRSPQWIPSEATLQSYRTSTRGILRNLRAGRSMEANTVSGSIEAR